MSPRCGGARDRRWDDASRCWNVGAAHHGLHTQRHERIEGVAEMLAATDQQGAEMANRAYWDKILQDLEVTVQGQKKIANLSPPQRA